MIVADDASVQVSAVKVLLATVVVVLAVYQTGLALVIYGRVRPRVPARRVAARAHRLIGAATLVLAFAVGATCLAAYDVGDALEDGGRGAVHVVAGSAALFLLAVKVLVVRGSHRVGRALPALGTAVLVLLVVTWASSAWEYLS